MRVAIVSVVKESWDAAPSLLTGLRAALARNSSLDASLWLVDDAAASRPDSWHSLETGSEELHVIELQGKQGRDRAFATALGYLICEREESFDAFLLLDHRGEKDAPNLEPLLEAAARHKGAVVLAPGGPLRRNPFSRTAHRLKRWFYRALCGELAAQSPAVLLPVPAAEALCHSCHGANHLESALRRLRLPLVTAAMPRGSCGLNLIAAASVFRDQAFARMFRASTRLCLLAVGILVAAAAMYLSGRSDVTPAALWAGAAITALLAVLALVSFLIGVFNQSLSEARRWTPAVDSSLLIREVTRVKRQPWAVNVR